jgi:hydroxypyruvate reductase
MRGNRVAHLLERHGDGLFHDLRQTARDIFAQALADCSIPNALDRVLHIDSAEQGARIVFAGQPAVTLSTLKHLRVVAMGKAAGRMLEALLTRLHIPPGCDLAGVLAAPERPADIPHTIQYFAGGHPTPNQASFDGAAAALSVLHAAAKLPPQQTLCLFLISGGASAMFEQPLDPSISLADTIAFHRALVHSGANIVEMNCVRKHFSAVKGGRLALAAGASRKLSLLISDVPPSHLDALASGPTLPDTTTTADCREILARYALLERFPSSVRGFFASRDLPETPKPGELDSPAITLLDSGELAKTAQTHATTFGFHTVIDNGCDDWPFDRAAEYLLDRVREVRRDHPRCCVISTGEVSVPVPQFQDAASHLGGRNQHLALHLATQLRSDDTGIALLSAGSDGIDGNSAAAGAAIDAQTIQPASGRESALRALAAFDSSTWLAAQGATIVTGPTGQNLRDLRILLAAAPA